MSPTKRERRLAEAVAQISARASERYPDEGSASQRQRAAIRRDAFVKGALWWRYREAADTRDTQPVESKPDCHARNGLGYACVLPAGHPAGDDDMTRHQFQKPGDLL